ncbi:uncharacterized protein METZ01_LOCUS172258 [marine metagenome]|uniref:Uncharacterized protein n=1 Tax=marine metagenome TaxID=408172 RepID=A0A382C0L7_9ZZZZ
MLSVEVSARSPVPAAIVTAVAPVALPIPIVWANAPFPIDNVLSP